MFGPLSQLPFVEIWLLMGLSFMKCAICTSTWFISLLPHARLSSPCWTRLAADGWGLICSVTAFVLCSPSHCSTTAAAPVAIHHRRTRGRRDTWGGVVSHFIHSLPALLGVLQGAARRLTEPAVMQLFWAYCGWGGVAAFSDISCWRQQSAHSVTKRLWLILRSLHWLIWRGAVILFSLYF